MLPRRNMQQRNVRDVMIDDLQREIHQLHQRLTRLEQRKVERQQRMQQKWRSHHPTALNDKEDNSPTFPDPGPLWSSEPNWDSEPKWDDEPNWDDNHIQLPDQSQIDVEEEEGDMIGPLRPPQGTWNDGSESELDDLLLNDKLQIPLSNEIVLKGHISGLTGGETTSNSGDESKEGEVAVVDRDRKSGRDESYQSVITIGEEEDGKSVASNDSDGGMDDDAMFRMDAYHVQLLKEKKLLVGADDMDIFKGISLKLLALEFLLKRNPDLRGKVVLIQIANPAWSIGKDVNVLQHAVEKDLDSAAWFDVPFEAENAVCEKGGTMRPPPWPSWRSESSLRR